jgi:hypothetical protein
VPLKVLIFAWRLFLNRIPTRDKIFQRRVLLISEQGCVANCGSNEDSTYLLRVVSLVFCGSLSPVDLVSQQFFIVSFSSTCISLVACGVLPRRQLSPCTLFYCQLFGQYGKNEIIDFFKENRTTCLCYVKG